MKTNAARVLDGLGIPYELREYDPGDEHLAAEEVARRVHLPPQQVFKTLLAKLSGDRKCDTVALKEVTPLTGYVRGGVTALACKKAYPVFVDETAELFDVISVSAGVRDYGVTRSRRPKPGLPANSHVSGPITHSTFCITQPFSLSQQNSPARDNDALVGSRRSLRRPQRPRVLKILLSHLQQRRHRAATFQKETLDW